MLIDHELLRFCADKTREIEEHYEADCIRPGDVDGFPRSIDDLDLIMQGHHGAIYHRQLRIEYTTAKFRSFFIPYADRIEIYYAVE